MGMVTFELKGQMHYKGKVTYVNNFRSQTHEKKSKLIWQLYWIRVDTGEPVSAHWIYLAEKWEW